MQLKIIFSDFDGTLTHENRQIDRTLFDIIDHLEVFDQELVVVSGRSLSWGHFLLTHLNQLNAAVMEGGGVILIRNAKNQIEEHYLVEEGEIQELENVTDELQRLFPKCVLSVDSFGRKTDRAIEFEMMQDEEINEVINFLKAKKINYSKSNVHINFWSGNISKYIGVMNYLENFRPEVLIEQTVFFGDAPNDQSMFEKFEHSVGVANIKNCLHRLEHKPKIILKGNENNGPQGVLNYIKNLNLKNSQ
jgi:HAD superfamily hydrolase (TIGR01484 family)